MSIQSRRLTECPTCRSPVEGRLFDSLNASRHPHFRELLLQRRLHRFECAGCSAVLEIDKPLLYSDFDRRQFLGCVPSPWRRDARTHAQALVASFERTIVRGPAVVAEHAHGFLVRVAFGYEELREKVVIDGTGLHDLVIEALKAELLAAEPWFQAEGVVTLTFDGLEADGRLRFFPVWLERRRSAVEHTVWVDAARYHGLPQDEDALLARYPGLASGPHVSVLRLAFSPDPAPPAPTPLESPV